VTSQVKHAVDPQQEANVNVPNPAIRDRDPTEILDEAELDTTPETPKVKNIARIMKIFNSLPGHLREQVKQKMMDA
jgi:hypothetical protein